MRIVYRALVGATSLLAFSPAAFAADAAPAADSETESGETQTIVVTGQRDVYGVKSTSTATKTNTPLRNIPQAMSVVSEAQIEDQSLRSVADLLMFVPGATPGTGESNRDQITLRGNNTTADFFVDGIRDDAQYFRDFYNLDRVEVLKGPNAMIFGRGGGGGIVNRVTKRATFTNAQQLLLSRDSEGGSRATADVDLALGGALGLRVNSVYEDGDSFRRHVDLKRYGINPTLGIAAGEDTRIDLSYEYFHDRRTADRGLPSVTDNDPGTVDRPLESYDRTFFGDPEESFAKANVQIANVAIEHQFSEGLKIRNRTVFADYDKFYQNIFAGSAVDEDTGDFTFGSYNSRNDRRNLISQTDLIWDGQIAGIEQTLLVGFEAGRQRSRNHRMTGSIVGGNAGNLDDPTIDRDVNFVSVPRDANNHVKANVAAAYIQSQLRPADWLELVAGLRFDRFKLNFNDDRPEAFRGSLPERFTRTDKLFSPRFGLVLKPQNNLSFYGSYSRSYLPQSGDQFSGLDPNTSTLKPERFDNYEVGAKWEPLDGLLATAAIYQLDRTNTRVSDPSGNGTFVLTGAQRTRGIELGLERSITARWQVSAGYALQKAKVTRSTTACPTGDCDVPLVPRHSGSLWTKYQLNKPFAVGLGVLARSRSYASISNLVELPGYVRVDGAAYYKLAPGIEAQLNVENLFNRDYFPTAHSDNNIAPGAPRTARLTLRADF